MANYNLTNQTISSSFQQLLQKDSDTGNLVDGLGNPIDGLDVDGIISSSFIGDGSGLTNLPTQTLPSGVISGSSQVDYPLISNIPSGIISSSEQLPSGIISSSEQLPSGIVSGSSQVDYPFISNIPSGIVSSSEQLPSGLISGSSQVSYPELSNIPSGIVSSSSQVVLEDTTYTDNGDKSFLQTDGAGNLSFQYVQSVYETIRNMSGAPIDKGTPVYISGSTGDNGNAYVSLASDPLTMPATYVAGEDLGIGETGLALVSGKVEGVNTSLYPAGTMIYVGESGGWTNQRPSGSDSVVQLLGVVQKQGVGGQGVLINQLEAVLPNITENNLWLGNSGNQPTQVSKNELGLALTGSDNIFTGNQTFNNLTVNGTGSFAYIESITGSAKIIGDAYIILNNDTPTERYAGIKVIDSGSLNTTASFQFDGQTNDWFYEYEGDDPTNFGIAMFGPEYSTKGTPTYNTNNTILKSNGGHHLLDSNITDDGSTITLGSATNISTGNLEFGGTNQVIFNPNGIVEAGEIASSVILTDTIEVNNSDAISINSNTQMTGSVGINGTTDMSGDLTLSNNSKVEVELGSSVNFYESNDGGFFTSALRFHSGSDSTGTKWINIQPEPGGEGRMAIAAFPENNHFMFFDPTDGVAGNQRVYIESTIEGGSNGGVLSVGAGLEVTGSTTLDTTTFNGTSTFNNTLSVNTAFIDHDDTSGLAVYRQNPNFFSEYVGSALAWQPSLAGGTTRLMLGEKAKAELQLNAFDTGYDNTLYIRSTVDGTSFSDWELPSYNTTPWLLVPQQEAPAFQRGLDITGSIGIDGPVLNTVDTVAISATTASIDFSSTSLFELTLGSGVDTHLVPTNVGVGQTINVLITQDATTAGTVSFSSDFLQPDGSSYVPTDTLGGQDILTLMTYNDTSKIYVVATNKFV
jgi:hypothetical protein